MGPTLGSIDASKITFRQPADALLRGLRESNAQRQLQEFHDYIHLYAELFQSVLQSDRHRVLTRDFLIKFDHSFNLWSSFLETMGTIPQHPNVLLHLLHLGMWDSAFCNDPQGKLTPFGPWLAQLGEAMGGEQTGLLHAYLQQYFHPHKEQLCQAQTMANQMYEQLLSFVEANGILALKPDYQHPPVVQLHHGGAVCWLKDFPVPTLICMDVNKADALKGYTALPHEFGHDLSGTFTGAALVESISQRISGLDMPHKPFWALWAEECFADAIGVIAIREAEVFSLANLFSDYYTNVIFMDENEPRPDEHPNRHVRVAVAIEVARLIGVDAALLDQTRQEWDAFGQRVNTAAAAPPDMIYDQFNDKCYPMAEFEQGVELVAEALVATPYPLLNDRTVQQIFEGFSSDIADQMRQSVVDKLWLP